MPLFETVMQEKPPVVLEIGTAYTKLGFAPEAFPRFIIPSIITCQTNGYSKKLFDYKSNAEFYDQVVDFLQKIFFEYTLVSPKDRKIIIVESIFCATIIRETFAKALFRNFEVSSIFWVPTHLVVLSTLAAESCMVIDMGYQEVSIIPVISGIQILQGFQAQPYGSSAIHKEIKRKLLEQNINENDLTEDVLEDIKVRLCFVTTFERAQAYRSGKPPKKCPDIKYSINGKNIITIPGQLRETIMEIMFIEDNEYSSLPHIILDSILKCPIDTRKILIENILLFGGSSMIPGLKSRLKLELMHLLASDMYSNKLFLKTIKFHDTPIKGNLTAWLGGSIYGGTDLVLSRSLSKEVYCRCSRLPDWVNLDDNRAPGS